jgi:hypothetical protein
MKLFDEPSKGWKLFDEPVSRIVKAFFWFGIIVIGIDIGSLFIPAGRPLHTWLLPYSGLVPSLPYLFTISNVTTPRYYGGMRKSLRIASLLLFLCAAIGVGIFVYLGGPIGSEDPYERISIISLVWAGVVPAVWGFLLLRESKALTPQC